MSHYIKFGLMILVSSLLMYAAMYLNTYSFDHIYWSETRAYMTLIMAAVMAVVMLLFMSAMLKNQRANATIFILAAIVFSLSLYLVRSQKTVDDLSWLRAMIPHHSIAILTSSRANIKDPLVQRLASQIIESQTREINQMKRYIRDLEAGTKAKDDGSNTKNH